MAISYQDIRTKRQWRAATGLTEIEFQELVPEFRKTYLELYGWEEGTDCPIQEGNISFGGFAPFLFYVLFSLKSGLTYDLLALSFGVSISTAFDQQAAGVRLLQMMFQRLEQLPRRGYANVEELKQHLDAYDELLIDGTEQRRQRPGDQADQKEDYSGKKKRTR